jgi:hypothetical protein
MAKLTIIDNPEITLWYYEETRIIHHKIHKMISGKTLRQTLMKGLELFKKNNASKWLSDDRQSSALTPEDTEWGFSVWSPQVIAAGWKYWAVVLPEIMLGQLNMNYVIDDYAKKGVTVELFSDPEAALKWLEEVK